MRNIPILIIICFIASLKLNAQNSALSSIGFKDTSSSFNIGFGLYRLNPNYSKPYPELFRLIHSKNSSLALPETGNYTSSGNGIESSISKQFRSGLSSKLAVGFCSLNESISAFTFGDKNSSWGEYSLVTSKQTFAYTSVNLGYDVMKFSKNKQYIYIIPYVGINARVNLNKAYGGSVFISDIPEWRNIDLSIIEHEYYFDKIYYDPLIGLSINFYHLSLDIRFQRFEKDYYEHKFDIGNKGSDKTNTVIVAFGLTI